LFKRFIALVWELLACFCLFFSLSAVYIKTVALMCGISSVFWAKVALTSRGVCVKFVVSAGAQCKICADPVKFNFLQFYPPEPVGLTCPCSLHLVCGLTFIV